MLDAFWSGVGEELAKTWVARVLTPAFVYWAAAVALVWWSVHSGGVAARGWTAEIAASATGIGALPVVVQIGLVVGALIGVVGSGLLAERLTLPVLRLLEGYALRPGWLQSAAVNHRRKRRRRIVERRDELVRRDRWHGLPREDYARLVTLRATQRLDDEGQKQLADLEKRAVKRLSPAESARLSRYAGWLATTPPEAEVMPTRLGDVLRAAERRPNHSYRLDGVTSWTALNLVMPAETRSALATARAAVNTAARSWLWAALIVLWFPVTPWALAVGVVLAALVYRFGVLPRAVTFGALLGASFDLHRMALYDALHLPRPPSLQQERAVTGPQATALLAGRLDADAVLRYQFRETKSDAGASAGSSTTAARTTGRR